MVVSNAFKTEEIGKVRITLGIAIIFAVFAILSTRLWYLQIVHGTKFELISQKNLIRRIDIPAPRGIIYDRFGEVILENRSVFSLALVPQYVANNQELEKTLQNISFLLNVPYETLDERFQKNRGLPKFHPITLVRDLTLSQVEIIEMHKIHLIGVDIIIQPRRKYSKDIPTHLMGILREISKKEIEDMNEDESNFYQLGDIIGKMGVEKKFEMYLRGEKGSSFLQVDAKGRRVTSNNFITLEDFKSQAQTPGNNLVLTIDFPLQRAAQEAMKEFSGSAFAINPNTGEILAMVSRPDFDPVDFEDGLTVGEWRRINENLHNPLIDRSTGGQYPPGSTYKPFVALAALHHNVISLNTRFNCPGYFALGSKRFGCWKKTGHGSVDVVRSLAESCDVFYYNIGARMNIDTIANYVNLFGFGEKSSLQLNDERTGLIPTQEWKKKTYKTQWYSGDGVPAAIGQGYVLVTPIQLLYAYGALATNGILYEPMLLKEITDPAGNLVERFEPKIRHKIDTDKKYFDAIHQGLWEVVNAPNGTAAKARVKNFDVCGKTGTAQNAALKFTEDQEDVSFRLRDHAWFTAFAPKDNPVIAILVLAEFSGGHGGSTAAPIAQKILQAYYDLRVAPTLTNQGAPDAQTD